MPSLIVNGLIVRTSISLDLTKIVKIPMMMTKTLMHSFLLAVDIERWSKWNEDWPSNYRYVSFLSRKLKFVHKHKSFVMVFFNYDRTKFICVNRDDIIKYPSGGRYTQGKMDSVIKIPFDDTRIYGSELTEREKFLFKNHKVREIK